MTSDSQLHSRSAADLIENLLRLGLLVLLLAVPMTGCNKVKEKFSGKTEEVVEEPPPPPYTPEQLAKIDQAREEAQKRYDALMEEAESFDAYAATARILLEKHKIDLSKIFPAGYSAEKLKTAKEVNTIYEERLKEIADKKFPDTMLDKIIKQANTEFPEIKVGDKIKVEATREKFFEGEVKEIAEDRIKIEYQYILLNDIVSPNPVCFNPAKAKQYRDHFVKVNYEIPRRDYIDEIKAKVFSKTMHEFGYVYHGRKWLPMDAFIAAEVAKPLAAEVAAYEEKQKRSARFQVRNELLREGFLEEMNEIMLFPDLPGEMPDVPTPPATASTDVPNPAE